MNVHVYLQNIRSGDVFAAEIRDGRLVSAIGPLYYKEITAENLDNFEYTSSDAKIDAEWLNTHADDWRLKNSKEYYQQENYS